MFAKLSILATSLLITLAAATPTRTPPVTPPSSPQCCNSVVSSSSSAVSAVAALLGLDLDGLNVPVGLSCSPITVIGNNCGGTTVTCDAPEKEWALLPSTASRSLSERLAHGGGFAKKIAGVREVLYDSSGTVASETAPDGLTAEDLVLGGTPCHHLVSSQFPPACVEVDVKLDDNGSIFDCVMTAGVVGMHVSSSVDLTLSATGKEDVVQPVSGG
ncbi:hypothetical protein C8R43DRAFT_1197992 [Mycena crocata]|nr:hypothetical protein C8R43DRAFT_1197992 [Mycena crocata]